MNIYTYVLSAHLRLTLFTVCTEVPRPTAALIRVQTVLTLPVIHTRTAGTVVDIYQDKRYKSHCNMFLICCCCYYKNTSNVWKAPVLVVTV